MEIERTPTGTVSTWNITTDDYNIKDFVIKNDNDEIIATVCFTSLKPGKSTRGHVDDHNEFYAFMIGIGVMMVDHDLHKIDLEDAAYRGDDAHPTVFVKKGKFHRVFNMSPWKTLNFLSVVPGEVKREPYSQTHDQH